MEDEWERAAFIQWAKVHFEGVNGTEEGWEKMQKGQEVVVPDQCLGPGRWQWRWGKRTDVGHILEASLTRFVDRLDTVGTGEGEVKGELRKRFHWVHVFIYSMLLPPMIYDFLQKNTNSTIKYFIWRIRTKGEKKHAKPHPRDQQSYHSWVS